MSSQKSTKKLEAMTQPVSWTDEQQFINQNLYNPKDTYLQRLVKNNSQDVKPSCKNTIFINMAIYQIHVQSFTQYSQDNMQTDSNKEHNFESGHQSILNCFEEQIKDRDMFLIRQKIEIKKHQQIFRFIFKRLISLLSNDVIGSFTKAEKQIAIMICRFEMIKTLREDKSLLSSENGKNMIGTSKSKNKEAFNQFIQEIADMEMKETSLLREDVEVLKKIFREENLQISAFEKIFRPKMMYRHNPQLVKSICAQLTKIMSQTNSAAKKQVQSAKKDQADNQKPEFDINTFSSATSTPINCKSQFSSVQNSTLKKRDYQVYHKFIKENQAEESLKAQKEIQKVEIKQKSELEPKLKKQKVSSLEDDKKQENLFDGTVSDVDSDSQMNIDEIKKPAVVMDKPLILAESLSSSCNNSQAREIKQKLGIGAKNDEFSFNGGPSPSCPPAGFDQVKEITTSRGITLRISPTKGKDAVAQLKPVQDSEPESIIDLEVREGEELDIDSQNSSVREMMNNTSARNAPSYTKSYISATQNYSQFSNNSCVSDLFTMMNNKGRARGGRSWMHRGSSIMNMMSQSQSRMNSQMNSRMGSQLNSRIGSAKQTPRGGKHPPNQKISDFFTASQQSRGVTRIDTPANPKSDMLANSNKVYANLRKQSQALRSNKSPEAGSASFKMPVNRRGPSLRRDGPSPASKVGSVPKFNISPPKKQNNSPQKMGAMNMQNFKKNLLAGEKSRSPVGTYIAGKQSARQKRTNQLLNSGHNSGKNSVRNPNPLESLHTLRNSPRKEAKFDNPEDLF